MRKLVIIETSDIGARYTGLAAQELGYEPLFICQLSNYQADTLKQIKEFQHIDCATGNADELLKVLNGHEHIEAVTTFLDSRLEVSVQLAQALQVKGLDRSILRLKDKFDVYDLHPSVMPETIPLQRRSLDEKLIQRFVQTYPKCVLKPRKTAGAIGAVIFKDQAPTYNQIVRHMESVSIPDHLDPDAWMLQRFLPGRLTSLEGFVHQGVFQSLGFTGRQKVGQTETVATFPEDSRLDPSVILWAQRACTELLQKANFHSGYFHIEFISGSEGCALIDANIGRLGGGGIGELLAIAYDIPPVQIFKHVIQTSLGETSESPYKNRSKEAISIAYGVPKSGFLNNIENTQKINGFHTQVLDCEQTIPALGANNWSWVGIATGAASTLAQELKELKMNIDHEVVTPCF